MFIKILTPGVGWGQNSKTIFTHRKLFEILFSISFSPKHSHLPENFVIQCKMKCIKIIAPGGKWDCNRGNNFEMCLKSKNVLKTNEPDKI
jgi:hypothetical protein